ncbi:CDP-glycerol glycerophosphotransferase family protein [Actinokineospora auranticolor]|nr:CDP-glycerol glycerophosphotransferase family protein [Actinokineospora auranticolor]
MTTPAPSPGGENQRSPMSRLSERYPAIRRVPSALRRRIRVVERPDETVARVVEARPEQARWGSTGYRRTVLLGAHTVTSLMRLEDICVLLEDDPRVQLVYTQVPDRLGTGVAKRLGELEVRVVPWEEAVDTRYDLAISASLHRMEDVPALRRFAAPHGAGYNKLWPRWSHPGAERPVYGLDRESLLDRDGSLVFDSLVLPHPDHLRTLARQCPEAVPAAIVAGDPCFDRLVACQADRERFRAGLGVRTGQTLVAVASTWGQESLLCRQFDLLAALPAALPADHRVIATLHPAVWSEHGSRQVRTWLRKAREAGVDLVDVGEDWRALVAAADVLIADHSSLTAYAAGVGVPVLLSHFPDLDIDPDSVLAELAACSPRLDSTVPLPVQLGAARAARAEQWEIARRRVATAHGLSADLIRQTLYRLLDLTEPTTSAAWPVVPVPRLVVNM